MDAKQSLWSAPQLPRRLIRRSVLTFMVGAVLVMADPAAAQNAVSATGAMTQPSDAAITSSIRQTLARDVRFRTSRLNVVTRNGIVVLTGTVDDESMQRAAESIARSAHGVRAVIGGHAAAQSN